MMAKKKAKRPHTPASPTWDLGATGPANRYNLIIEERVETELRTGRRANPNGVKGARRVDMLEVWYRKGMISSAGYSAAEALRNAFEATQRGSGWPDNDRVQSSPKPDHAVAIQIDRISRLHAINRLVDDCDRDIIDTCVLFGRTPASLARYRGRHYQDGLAHLSLAIDRLASRMASGARIVEKKC